MIGIKIQRYIDRCAENAFLLDDKSDYYFIFSTQFCNIF